MINSSKSIIQILDKKGLCLGCGLCESILGKESVEMTLKSDGFLHPVLKKETVSDKQKIIQEICPGKNIRNTNNPFSRKEKIWGKVLSLYSSYSLDNEVRTKGSSGGTVSELAIYMLEQKIVDTILQVGGESNDYTRNSLKISKSKKDILDCASSRYAPAALFSNIINILENSNDTFCFIGKPCDISALKNLLEKYPQYNNRFKLCISIICAGLPSFNGTAKAIQQFNPKLPVSNLRYRGGGWPGNFSFLDNQGDKYEMSYNDSWGKILGRTVHPRCKICPDGIGIQADIAIGDAWETKDGYPDFTEKEGQSLTIIRTLRGEKIFEKLSTAKRINKSDIPINKIRLIQPYQYERRVKVGARIMAFRLTKGVKLNYSGLRTFQNLLKENPLAIAKEFMGSIKRFMKN